MDDPANDAELRSYFPSSFQAGPCNKRKHNRQPDHDINKIRAPTKRQQRAACHLPVNAVVEEAGFSRILDVDNAARQPYRTPTTQTHSEKPTLHWGQRKLLMSEIEFLSSMYVQCASSLPLIVYAGAAPGYHIPFLVELFPCARFVLVDPSTFGILPHERITIRQECFTDAVAREFTGAYIPRLTLLAR